MKLEILKIVLIINLLLITSCKTKEKIVTEVISIPQKTLVTPEISLTTLFRNDSLVFIDTNKVVVILKRDTLNKTIQVKAKCPEEKVIKEKELVTLEKKVYKTNWLSLFLTAILFLTIGLTFKNVWKWKKHY